MEQLIPILKTIFSAKVITFGMAVTAFIVAVLWFLNEKLGVINDEYKIWSLAFMGIFTLFLSIALFAVKEDRKEARELAHKERMADKRYGHKERMGGEGRQWQNLQYQ